MVLVGWYLLLPPTPGAQPPYGTWEHAGSYDSAADCVESKHRSIATLEALYKKVTPHRDITADRLWQRYIDARCVASDDQRLK